MRRHGRDCREITKDIYRMFRAQQENERLEAARSGYSLVQGSITGTLNSFGVDPADVKNRFEDGLP